MALLSAGSYHGAAHQAPMTFCVMTEPPTMREKRTKKYATRFFYRQEIPMDMEEKLQDEEFLSDTDLILGPEVEYDVAMAWTKVHDELVVRLMR